MPLADVRSLDFAVATDTHGFLQALRSVPGVRAGWIERVPSLTISGDRAEAMRQLRPWHEREIRKFAPAAEWWRAEQVHDNAVAVVPDVPRVIGLDGLPEVPGVDGLLTVHPGYILTIYAADCGVIWLADRETGAIGLLHSGKKGTRSGILPRALETMRKAFGTQPQHLIAVLGPCIRPPNYECDFALEIGRQAQACRLGDFFDCGLDTAADLSRFYSYRKEMGKTGRMMAMIVRDA